MKNPKAERRIALNSLERSITIPVTGTPMENKLLDLWSIVDFTIPNLLGKQSTFEKNFIDSEDNATILNKIINPVILKRMVSDVADDLPERMDINIPITLTTDLKKYLEILQETISMYPKNGAMVATTRLQIFCAHPSLQNVLSKNHKEVDDENFLETSFEDIPLISSYDKNLYNPKIEITKQIIQEAVLNNDKILIFALFNKCGPIIKNECKDIKNMYWDYINGSTPQIDRQNIIDDFSKYNGPACLVLNPKAAGAGLNITSATVVIHFTQYWNPAIEMQASARVYRRGQTKPVESISYSTKIQ